MIHDCRPLLSRFCNSSGGKSWHHHSSSYVCLFRLLQWAVRSIHNLTLWSIIKIQNDDNHTAWSMFVALNGHISASPLAGNNFNTHYKQSCGQLMMYVPISNLHGKPLMLFRSYLHDIQWLFKSSHLLQLSWFPHTDSDRGWRYYLETDPDPIAMVIRVEQFIHKPADWIHM